MAGTVHKVDDSYKEQKEREVRERIANRPFFKSPLGCGLLIAVLCIVLLVALGGFATTCASRASSDYQASKAAETAAHAGEIQPPYISDETNKDDAVTMLESAGFTNVTTEGNGRLVNGVLHHENDVEEISINGKTSWSSGSWYKPDAKIVVRYWSYKN